MNASAWGISCLLMAAIFALLWLVFALRREKAADLVAGFNSLTESQKNRYDRAAIARDYRDWMRMVTEFWLLGAALAQWLGPWAFAAAMAATLFACAREFHIDWEKAFEKYKINN